MSEGSGYETLLTLEEVSLRVGLSSATIHAMMKRGEFPASRRIGLRSVRWRSADLDDFIRGLPTTVDVPVTVGACTNATEHSPASTKSRRSPVPVLKSLQPDNEPEKYTYSADFKNQVRISAVRHGKHRDEQREQIRRGDRGITYRDLLEGVVLDTEVDPSWLKNPPDHPIYLEDVARLLKIRGSAIWGMIKFEGFPHPLFTDYRCFLLSEVDGWRKRRSDAGGSPATRWMHETSGEELEDA